MDGRSTVSVYRGRRFFAICTFVLCMVIYIVYTDQSIVKKESTGLFIPVGDSVKLFPNLVSVKTIQNKLLHSKWIKLFPSLEHMVTQIDDTHTKHITSAKKTFILINNNSDNLEVGKILTAYIIAKDEFGKRKKYGGDFFFVSLRRSSSKIDSVSCDILDEMNGSYRVTCILPWPGDSILKAVLIHPSESIYQMMRMYSSEREYGVLLNNTMQNSSGKKDYALCTLGFPEKRPDELCDYSNPTYGEPYKCIKPKSGECAKITWNNDRVTDYKLLAFWDNVYFIKNVNFNLAIGGSGTAISIRESTNGAGNYVDSDTSKISLSPISPSGWFFESKWMFNQTMTTDFNVSQLHQFVQNTDFYFIGDSTIRQWYSFFKSILKIKDYGPDNRIAWTQPRDGFHSKLNATLHYRAHGIPLHNLGPPDSRPYISATLDSIKTGGKGTIAFLTLGYHFELYGGDVFWDRLQIVKTSIKTLLERLPGTIIFIKGLHIHGYSTLCPSPWLAYRYDVMMRHAFTDIEGLAYLPLWDITSLAGNTLLHPASALLKKEVGFFLSMWERFSVNQGKLNLEKYH